MLGGPFRVFSTQAAQFSFDVAGEFFSCDALRDGRGIETWAVITLFGATVRALVVFEARFSVPLLPTVTIATLTIPRTATAATFTVPLLPTVTIATLTIPRTATAATFTVPLLPTVTITALTIPRTAIAAVVLALRSGITALKAAAAVWTTFAALSVV